ncbi:MAG: universal stress protein [Deltaproteobacteria bacterium]|nr:universal stress protein [Deltaproteobacteria bacterium]
MFKKILYATDFSNESMAALEYIKQLRSAGAEEVIILNVVDRRGLSDLSRYARKDLEGIQEDLEKKATAEMKPIEKDLKDHGFKVHLRVEKGGPFNEILRVAEEEDVSLIVTGSRGTGNFEELFLGSVSYKVVRKVRKPVLVIKT